MLVVLLACTIGTSNTDFEAAQAAADTADTADTGATDCEVAIDPSGSVFTTLQIDGLTLVAIVDGVCFSEDGSSVEIAFHVEGGESGTITYRGNPQGTYNLPLANATLELTYGERTWSGTDWLSGFVSQYGDYGDLSGTAYSQSGGNLTVYVTWGNAPVAE